MSYFFNNYGYGKGKGYGQYQSYGSYGKGGKGKSKGQGGFKKSYFAQFGDQGERRGLCFKCGGPTHGSCDYPAPYIKHVFNYMKTLVHEAQTILERGQVDTAMHERLFGLKRKKEVTTTAYDKKVKSNCAVMTTGWSPMTNLREAFEFRKKHVKGVQGITPFKPPGSGFVLATIIFVLDTPTNASTFLKACNRREE